MNQSKDTKNCQIPAFHSAEIVKLAMSLIKYGDQVLHAKCDLTYAQFKVLCIVKMHQEITQKELAGVLDSTEAGVSRLIETLTSKKFVTRTENPHNRRQNHLKLTTLGDKHIEKGITLISSLENKLYQTIPAQQLKNCLETITQLNTLLHKYFGA